MGNEQRFAVKFKKEKKNQHLKVFEANKRIINSGWEAILYDLVLNVFNF